MRILRLQRSIGNRATTRMIQRSVVTTGPAAAVRFRVGVDVGPAVAALGWSLTEKGPLDDAGIRALRQAALGDETIDDNERMFIAALLDEGNARRLHAENPLALLPMATVEFPVATITRANRDRVRDFERGASPTRLPLGDVTQSIIELAGPFAAAARDALAIADAAKVSHDELYLAMLNGASDSTPGDRAFAAAVYAIARQQHLDAAADIMAGRVKIDQVHSLGIAQAAYQSEPSRSGTKGDTLYLPSAIQFLSLNDQATVVHELTHEAADAAATQRTQPSLAEIEAPAFRAEAAFLLKSVAIRTGDDRARAVEDVARNSFPMTLLSMMLVATDALDDEESLAALKEVHDKLWSVSYNAATAMALPRPDFDRLLADLESGDERLYWAAREELERRVADAIRQQYGNREEGPDAGLRGESALDTLAPARR